MTFFFFLTVHNIILKIWTTVRGLLFFVAVHKSCSYLQFHQMYLSFCVF